MSYRGIEPPETIDLYRYQNGEITIRQVRAKNPGTGPPWHSFKTHTRLEDKARKRLAAWMRQYKIEGVDPATVPLITSATPRSSQAKAKPNLPAVIPPKPGTTSAERKAYKNGYQAASYHVRKGNGKAPLKASGMVAARDVVGALAASMNASAVILRLLQDATDDPTSD